MRLERTKMPTKKKKPTKTNEVCGTAKEPVTQVMAAPCSLELSRDAKGQPRWSIKLYGEREDMDAVLDQVMELDQKLLTRTRHREE